MFDEEKLREFAKKVREHTDRYGFPTKPKKKKKRDKKKTTK